MKLSEIDRRDPCHKFAGELLPGSYALIISNDGSLGEKDVGKVVFLAGMDSYGFFQSKDRAGNVLILHPDSLMPVTIDDTNELNRFLYEARYGS